MKELDCSIGEGGGSIVRIAAAIAGATRTPLHLYNIRGKRSNPGLRAQHVESLKAISQLSGIKIQNLNVGAQEIDLLPSQNRSARSTAFINIKTAGNISLVSQSLLYYAILKRDKITVNINGGATYGKWAPSIDYTEKAFHYLLKLIGINARIDIEKYGFYPKGGAKAKLTIDATENIKPLNMTERGDINEIYIYSVASKVLERRQVAERQIAGFLGAINNQKSVNKNIFYVNTLSTGTALTVITKYSNNNVKGCLFLGERDIKAEDVGRMCAKKWTYINYNKGALDEHLADQLIIPLSNAEHNSVISTDNLTEHIKTNIYLAEQFLKTKFEIEKKGSLTLIKIIPKT